MHHNYAILGSQLFNKSPVDSFSLIGLSALCLRRANRERLILQDYIET